MSGRRRGVHACHSRTRLTHIQPASPPHPPRSLTQTLGYQLGAALYTLEHRWYGGSLPAPLTDAATFASTLTVETVMEDLAAFATFLRGSEGCKAVGVVGGSYAGALSAWFRETHPELADFSWSSSGVVNAVFSFTEFDERIVADVPLDCLASLQAITGYAEQAWDDPTQRDALLALFNTPSYFTRSDFLWSVADSGAMGPQYGYKDLMCSYVVPLPPTPWGALQQWANWTITHYGASVAGACYYSTFCLSAVDNATMIAQWPNQRPWVYECCNELAYWQVAYPGSIRSSAITADYYVGQCKSAFGPDVYPDTASFNARYGGPTPNATKVVACNGSDDPWQGAAVKSTISAEYPMFLATCDGCGHCGDLHGPSAASTPAIKAQQAAVEVYVSAWAEEALARAQA